LVLPYFKENRNIVWKTRKVVENFFKDLILEKKELFQTDVEAQLIFSLKFGVKETYLA